MGLSQAIQYAQRGWSVVPIPRGEKHPVGMSWDEFKTRCATPDEIRAWIAKGGEDQNVGIITGAISGLVVVDADGASANEELTRRGVVSPLRVQTTKGYHYYFSHPGGSVKNAVRITGRKEDKEGIDVRADGGLVVAPPSIHESGRVYRWIGNPLTKLPVYDPNWFPVARPVGGRRDPGWVADALKSLAPGNRDSLLVSIVGKMMRDGWEDDAIKALLGFHPEVVAHGLPELDRIVKSVRRYHRQPMAPVVEAGTATLSDFMAEASVTEWIVPGVVAKNAIGFIAGLPETCKTWMTMDLALEAARGGLWLGMLPSKPVKVLLIDQERYAGETRRRLGAMMAEKEITPNALDGQLTVVCGTAYRIDNDSSFEGVRGLISRTKPELVLIDSFATFHGAEENDRSSIQKVIERIKQLRAEFGITILFIDHESKGVFQADANERPSAMRMVGSVAKVAAAELVLTVRSKAPGTSAVYMTKSTLAPVLPPFYVSVTDIGGPQKIRVRGAQIVEKA